VLDIVHGSDGVLRSDYCDDARRRSCGRRSSAVTCQKHGEQCAVQEQAQDQSNARRELSPVRVCDGGPLDDRFSWRSRREIRLEPRGLQQTQTLDPRKLGIDEDEFGADRLQFGLRLGSAQLAVRLLGQPPSPAQGTRIRRRSLYGYEALSCDMRPRPSDQRRGDARARFKQDSALVRRPCQLEDTGGAKRPRVNRGPLAAKEHQVSHRHSHATLEEQRPHRLPWPRNPSRHSLRPFRLRASPT
jgi:hypothetical protein